MRHSLALAAFVASLTSVSACDDNSTTPDAAASPDARPAGSPDARPTATADAPASTGDAPAATADAPAATADAPAVPDAGPTFSLTIHDYLSWCDVTANGAFFSNAQSPSSVSMNFPQHSVVNLHAAPSGSFVWGYWTGTDHNTEQSTTLTLDADTTIMVCCPETSGTCTF